MKHRKMKPFALCIIAGLLALTSFAVVYADILLARIYTTQQQNIRLSAQATPIPVLSPVPSPAPALTPVPAATPSPSPTRKPLPGDIIGVNFPNYDTGVGADYSHQSDELRIAVNKVEEDGVTYYVADIWMRNINCFRTAFAGGENRGKREAAEKIAQNNNAILAVNGDFLAGLVIRNGVLYRKASLRPVPTPEPAPEPEQPVLPDGEQPIPPDESAPAPGQLAVQEVFAQQVASRPQRATCVLYYDGKMVTEEYDAFRSSAAMERGAWQGWQFGPTLVRNGKAVKDVNAQGRNPRCIIGYYEPGHYCLVMIDGRQKGYSIGMNFKEMIDLSMRLGLQEAYNLDGGASAIMVYGGEIINQPSGKGDARKLPDMVVIGEYLAPEQLFVPTPSPGGTAN